MPATQAVELDEIIMDERCQPRLILNPDAVQEYAELYEAAEATLPPLDVVDVNGALVLIDGFHRLAGARKAGRGFIRVKIVAVADLGRAAWLASAVNQGHGVRRSNADKRKAVMLALESDVGQEQDSRTIAAHVGVSHTLVNNIRQEMESGNRCQDDEPEPPPAPPEDEDERPEPDMYHTAAARIKGCYRKVCAILGEEDDVCEALYVALEKAKEREL